MGSAPIGVQCPLTSSLGEFLGYWSGSGILGYRPCGCPSPSPSPSISRCFLFTLLNLPLDFIRVSSLRPTYRHSAPNRSTLHLLTFKVSFQAWDWLWYLMLWSKRRNRGVHGAEIPISALVGVEPRTLASSGRERYH